MTAEAQLTRRVLRRELHSPRSGLAILLAVVAILALAWVATEGILAALGQRALLLSPSAMVEGVRGLPSVPPGLLITAAVVLVVAGLATLIAAVLPGRRGRHILDGEGSPAVVDDEVIGSALVQAAAASAGIDPDRAVANVGRRTATVRITGTSGVRIDQAEVERAVARTAEELHLTPPVRTRVVLEKNGRVGG